MKPIEKLIVPTLLLAGCNASETSTETPAPTGPVYETLSSNTTGTTTLAGVSMTTNAAGGLTVRQSSGSIKRPINGGEFTLDDGNKTIKANNGFSSGFAIADDGMIVKLVTTGTNYKYMQAYETSYFENGQRREVLGLFGNPTRSADLPSTGNATYTGEAEVGYLNKNGVVFGHTSSGTATISADFEKGTVGVESKFTSFIDTNNNAISSPTFDKIERTGMKISGGTFAGGSDVFTKNGTVVDPIGANSTTQAKGRFFGGKVVGAETMPAEVGGISVTDGDDGLVTNVFMGN